MSKVNKDLEAIVQAKWEKVMTETESSKLALPVELFKIMRVYFQLAYQEGYADVFQEMKEVYHNDPDLFEAMFDDDSNHDADVDKDEQGLLN